MKILLDTNILVHAYNKSSPHQSKASKIVKKALQGEIDAFVSSQVLYEFFAIVTNPKRVEHPMPSEEAADLCTELWACHEIEKINPTPTATREVFKLANEMKLSKGRIFDCILAIVAKENRIEAICTENVDDFKKYKFIKIINPLI